jgi:hypothetical protein
MLPLWDKSLSEVLVYRIQLLKEFVKNVSRRNFYVESEPIIDSRLLLGFGAFYL